MKHVQNCSAFRDWSQNQCYSGLPDIVLRAIRRLVPFQLFRPNDGYRIGRDH